MVGVSGLVNHVQSWRIPATMLGYIVIAAAVVMFANLWLRRFFHRSGGVAMEEDGAVISWYVCGFPLLYH